MNDTVRTISLAQIITADHTCRITTRTGREDLTPSIHKMGVINPPILIEKSDGFTIVAGFRRIEACGNLGWHSILAKILEPRTPELQCAQLAICDNALQRPLNLHAFALYKRRSIAGESGIGGRSGPKSGLSE
jgi:ParB family chromosome partitioning protein